MGIGNTKFATIMGFIAIVLWSTLPIASLYNAHLPPFLTIGIAYLASAALHFCYWRYKYGSFFTPFQQINYKYIIVSVLGIFGSNSTFLLAMKNGDPVISYLTLNLWPIVALFMGAAIYKESISKSHYLGLILGTLGVISIAFNNDGASVADPKLLGIFFALLNAFIWSIFSILTRQFQNIPANYIGFPLFICSILAFITHYMTEVTPVISMYDLGIVMYMGLMPWGIAYTMWGLALRFGDMKKLIVLSYFAPVLGLLWLVLSGKTEFTIPILISMILIIAASLVTTKKES